jgi:hypothetical protein
VDTTDEYGQKPVSSSVIMILDTLHKIAVLLHTQLANDVQFKVAMKY